MRSASTSTSARRSTPPATSACASTWPTNRSTHTRAAPTAKRHFGSAAIDWKIARGVKLELDAEYQERSQKTVPAFQLLDGVIVPQDVDPRVLMSDQPWNQPTFFRTTTLQARLEVELAKNWSASMVAHSMRRKADDYVAFPYGFYSNYDFDVYDYRSIDETRSPRRSSARARDAGHRRDRPRTGIRRIALQEHDSQPGLRVQLLRRQQLFRSSHASHCPGSVDPGRQLPAAGEPRFTDRTLFLRPPVETDRSAGGRRISSARASGLVEFQ
jgi:hypothetical protein